MDITFVTTAERDDEALALLARLGMPFRRQTQRQAVEAEASRESEEARLAKKSWIAKNKGKQFEAPRELAAAIGADERALSLRQFGLCRICFREMALKGRSQASAKRAGRGDRNMGMTDPVADCLTRIRNARRAKHKRVDIPASKIKVEIARILQENHFIQNYKVLDDSRQGMLRIYLKYVDEKPVVPGSSASRSRAYGCTRTRIPCRGSATAWDGDRVDVAGAADRPPEPRGRGRRDPGPGLVGRKDVENRKAAGRPPRGRHGAGRRPGRASSRARRARRGTRLPAEITARVTTARSWSSVLGDESRDKAMQGLARSLVANMVEASRGLHEEARDHRRRVPRRGEREHGAVEPRILAPDRVPDPQGHRGEDPLPDRDRDQRRGSPDGRARSPPSSAG